MFLIGPNAHLVSGVICHYSEASVDSLKKKKYTCPLLMKLVGF